MTGWTCAAGCACARRCARCPLVAVETPDLRGFDSPAPFTKFSKLGLSFDALWVAVDKDPGGGYFVIKEPAS